MAESVVVVGAEVISAEVVPQFVDDEFINFEFVGLVEPFIPEARNVEHQGIGFAENLAQ
jgi:hypothetical protein